MVTPLVTPLVIVWMIVVSPPLNEAVVAMPVDVPDGQKRLEEPEIYHSLLTH